MLLLVNSVLLADYLLYKTVSSVESYARVVDEAIFQKVENPFTIKKNRPLEIYKAEGVKTHYYRTDLNSKFRFKLRFSLFICKKFCVYGFVILYCNNVKNLNK